MNLKRGLWRTWLVLTALFILFVALSRGGDIISEFGQKAEVDALLAGAGEGVPIACSEARGKSGEDWHKLAPISGNNPNFCWYPLPKFRKYYPELATVPDLDLLDAQYYKAGVFFWKPHPWQSLAILSALAFIPSLAVFALGWALLGFARSENTATQ